MLRLIAPVLLGLILVTGCGKMTVREREQTPVERHLEDQLVLGINGAQADLKAAIDLAFPAKIIALDFLSVPPLRNSKVEEMRKALVADGICEFKGSRPTADAMSEYEIVDSAKGICPISLWEKWTFDSAKGVWEIDRTFKVIGKEFYQVSDVYAYKVNGGFTFKRKEGAREVSGELNYYHLTFSGLENAKIVIATKQKFMGREGGGTVTAVVSVGNKAAAGTITWTEYPNARQYMINGLLVEKKDFDERFSAYGLDEIIDSSRKLR